MAGGQARYRSQIVVWYNNGRDVDIFDLDGTYLSKLKAAEVAIGLLDRSIEAISTDQTFISITHTRGISHIRSSIIDEMSFSPVKVIPKRRSTTPVKGEV